MAGEYILVFDITGTDIALQHTRHETTASSLRADKCCFYFDSDWDDYGGKMALFGADRDRLKPVLLSVDRDEEQRTFYYCYIPRDVLAQLSTGGNIYIAVQGEQATAGFTPAVTDALEQVSALRTKFYNLNIADSGQIEFYITAQEEADFLAQVGAALSTMRSENDAAIALLEGKSIENAAINAAHELVITMQNGTVYNLGNVQGEQGVGIASVRIDGSGKLLITLSTGQVLDLGNIRGQTGDSIKNAEVIDGVLWLTMLYGSRYSAGYVKGEKGDTGATGAKGAKGAKGDKGDTGAQGIQGVPGADGVSITGVTATLDAQNRRVFTFSFSDGTTRAVIVPGEVITVTDEEGEFPVSITVQEAVQTLSELISALDDRTSTNAIRIAALDTGKQDKIIVTGTDSKRYAVQFGMANGKPVLNLQQQ